MDLARALALLVGPTMKKLVVAGLSYDEVMRLVRIPRTWGARVSGEQFRERASETLRADNQG
jgi:hypothetical protein